MNVTELNSTLGVEGTVASAAVSLFENTIFEASLITKTAPSVRMLYEIALYELTMYRSVTKSVGKSKMKRLEPVFAVTLN